MDLKRINPNQSLLDIRIEIADELVRDWMKVPDNLTFLRQKKAEYLHRRGWSLSRIDGTKGNFKAEYDIPQEAFFALPSEIRNHPKELKKWVELRHPYLLFKK